MKYMFFGLETKNWTHEQWKAAGQRCKAHGYDTAFFKIADGAGLTDKNRVYYTDAELDRILQSLQDGGVEGIPYVYSYGDKFKSLQDEIAYASRILAKVGRLCADMEVEWNADKAGTQLKWAETWTKAFQPIKGSFYISTWANIAEQNWNDVAKKLDPCVDIWLPQVYTSYLASVWWHQWNGASVTGKPRYPTYRPDTVDANVPNRGLWEYSDLPTSLPVDPNLDVVNLVQVSQFEPNETQFACGFFAAAQLKYATRPGVQNNTSPETIDATADAWYDLQYGNHDVSQMGGVSIDDMHALLNAGGNHYQDVSAISTTSRQSSDIAQIQAALAQGFPVVATVREGSLYDLDLGGSGPYAWANSTTQATHVVLFTRIQGTTIFVQDPANIDGDLNGQNTVRAQPRRYDASQIEIHWASMVQVNGLKGDKWLPSIPAGYDPVTGPKIV